MSRDTNKILSKLVIILINIFIIKIYAQTASSFLVDADNNLCLEASSYNIAAKITAKPCNFSDNQKFMVQNGFIKSVLSTNKCLSTNSKAENAPVMLWQCSDGPDENQNFNIQDQIYLASNNNFCLIKDQSSNDIVLGKCNNSQPISISKTIKTYNDKCLHLNNSQPGSLLLAKDCDNSANQQFFLNNNTYRMVLDTSKCLNAIYSNNDLDNEGYLTDIKKISVAQCNAFMSDYQKFNLANNSISLASTDNFCFTYIDGNKFEMQDPIVLANCQRSSTAPNYLRQKFY